MNKAPQTISEPKPPKSGLSPCLASRDNKLLLCTNNNVALLDLAVFSPAHLHLEVYARDYSAALREPLEVYREGIGAARTVAQARYVMAAHAAELFQRLADDARALAEFYSGTEAPSSTQSTSDPATDDPATTR